MSHKSIAVLVLSCLGVMGSLDGAWSASAPRLSVTNSLAPLPPAGPATIKQAQGTDWSGPLLGAAITGGIFLAVVLLINDDANGPTITTLPTTGTH